MNSHDLFVYLIQKIVSENGRGHAELKKRIEAGELSEEDGVLIKLHANLLILNSKLTNLGSKVDAIDCERGFSGNT